MVTELSAEDVIRAVARSVGKDADQVTAASRIDQLVTDSFGLVELAMDIQDDFDVVLYSDDLAEVRCVADLVHLVRSRS